MRDGLVVVDKPPGWTSHDVVARLRRVYGQRRVGHAGTLDPDATGVLLVGLGRATRLLRYLSEAGKAYTGRVVFGIATSTLDAAGEVLDQRPMVLTRDEIEQALPRFIGDIEQLPPMVSAVKIGGRRLHELARAGRRSSVRPDRCTSTGSSSSTSNPARTRRPRSSWSVAAAPTCGRWPRTSAPRSAASRTSPRSGATVSARSPSTRRTPSPRSRTRPMPRSCRSRSPCATWNGSTSTPSRRVPSATACRSLRGAIDVRGDGPYALVGPDGDLLAVYGNSGVALKPAVVVVGA